MIVLHVGKNTVFGNRRLFDDFETVQGRGFQIWTNDNNIEILYV